MVAQHSYVLVNKRRRYEVGSHSVQVCGTKGTEGRISSTSFFAVLGISVGVYQ